MTPEPRVTAVVLAYGDEPDLVGCVDALLGSHGCDVDVVLVDNGCTSGDVERVADRPRLTLLRPGENLGYTGGCNLGAARATGDFLALVNSDAVVAPDALARLVEVARDPLVGIATASVRLADRPDVINSAGNPVHWSGLSWAGALGEPASAHATDGPVTSASGATMVLRRETWLALEGLWEELFAYGEDLELSLRCWQRGLQVRYVASAVSLHRYEFSRTPLKFYLLERNRLLVLLTLMERRTLVALAPALLGLEVAMAATAARGGWFKDKASGWWWILRHRGLVRRRRAWVQATRSRRDHDLTGLFTADFSPGESTGLQAPRPAVWASRAYWRRARPLI